MPSIIRSTRSLGSLPNPEMTSYQLQFALMWQLLLYGRAYAEIVRSEGRIVALWPLVSEYMQVDRDAQRRKRWTYSAGATPLIWLFDPSQPPILELTAETPIHHCREVIGSALALQQYTANFFKNHARPAVSPGRRRDRRRHRPTLARLLGGKLRRPGEPRQGAGARSGPDVRADSDGERQRAAQ